MIRFLPNIYPDELLFSYLSRCYARSGYIWNSGFAKEVFETNAKNIDCTLLNILSLQFKELIDQSIGLDKIILEHTLFKYYARFLPLSKRKNVFQRALRNEPFLSQHLPIPLNTNTSCLRYCPICVKEDRATYGEAYIHATHTIPEIITCPKHCCKLIPVEFIREKINNTSFTPIEISITDLTEDIFEESDINVKVSRYIASAFLEPLNTSKEMIIGNFLSNKLEDKYISARGEQRRLEILFPDMQDFYSGLFNFNLTKSRLARIYKNSSYNPYDILLASMFQQIPPNVLCAYKGSSQPKHILFDKRVRAMHQSGMSMNRISLELNVNHEVIRQIIIGTYDKPKHICSTYKSQRWNWEKIDDECSKEFYARAATLDKRYITKGTVAELFGLRDKSLRNLPRLNALVQGYKTIK